MSPGTEKILLEQVLPLSGWGHECNTERKARQGTSVIHPAAYESLTSWAGWRNMSRAIRQVDDFVFAATTIFKMGDAWIDQQAMVPGVKD